MSDDLDKLWGSAKPVARPPDDLDALWQQAQAATPAGPSAGEAIARGGGQGATLGFLDEMVGAAKTPLRWLQTLNPHNPSPPTIQQKYREARDEYRAVDEAARSAHPNMFMGGELAGAVGSSFLPGLNAGGAASLTGSLGRLALQGGLTGLGNSKADLTQGEYGKAALDTGIGAGIGAGTGLIGAGAGKLGGIALRKVAGIDETVARTANALAEGETASARSAAGHAAQDAYRQLEHLRELGAMRMLTPEQAQTAAALEAELGAKTQAKLLPAIARKEASAAAFADATQAEGQRASAIAAAKLSPGELKQQVVERALRYGPALLGGALLGHSHGGFAGAALGGAAGAAYRPMLRSLIRMAKQPVVQRPLWEALSNLAPGAEGAIEHSTGEGVRMLEPRLASLLEALRQQEPAMAQDTRRRPVLLSDIGAQ